jgi:hypothetical protein
MALGRKNVPVAGTNSGADVFRLAGFLGDDNLIRHEGLGWRMRFESAGHERLVNNTTSQATFWWVRGQAAKPGRERRPAVDGARQSAARRRSRGCRLRHRRESSSFGAAVLFAFQGQDCVGPGSAPVSWSRTPPPRSQRRCARPVRWDRRWRAGRSSLRSA